MPSADVDRTRHEPWPPLPYDEWTETLETLHRWTQIVGKIALAQKPFLNEWWNVAFPLTARGMTTGIMPAVGGTLEIDFDFVEHRLDLRRGDGQTRTLPLRAQSVAAFYRDVMAALAALGTTVTIDPRTVELPVVERLDQDETHASYDPDAANRWQRVMLETALVMQRFRTPFVGKSSPIHFFWGSFDLCTTRFSGRSATVPASAPRFYQLAEDQENFTCGFWPGNPTMSGLTLAEPAFYAYGYPEPPGCRAAPVQPQGAAFGLDFGEFLLPYDDVRAAPDPDAAVLSFFQSTYDVVANLGAWDRAELERPAAERER
ncbi:MAG TPA: DUF5996 family protein [Thermomicrobiales bacterium]|nr:DUF5996 family protein [Thermomicrobiales bacterium]